ncbi:hypothetical protein HC251_07300 [Iamia sp. SCSIO 61187]|uniref:hypothetical protein n=1 Tax=Iamia sp. SCSIO 61187 TaxID=2722752 RepID=UPI001C63315B|nr:hypothetical protein [Iamia sp. SCSIO 61187]QYG92263.1 hypothetical protein HC251_07300 [Iamia sp. SCSIO 61187]
MRPASRDAPPVAPVVALGAVSVLGTSWFAWSLPAAPSRRTRAGAALAEDVGPWRWAYDHLAPPSSSALAASLVAVAAVMFVAWAGAIAVTWRRSSPARVRAIVWCVGLACAVSVLALPTHSSDIYDYALFGRVASDNGGEPYHDLPDAYPDDPLYRYSSHQYTGHPDNKLPVWTMAATGVTALAGDHPIAVVLALRGLLATATLLATVLVARIAHRLRPDGAAAAAAVFGLCPVTLTYGGAKTDALMVLLMLVGLALVADDRSRAGTALTTLAVMVKAIAAPVLALVVLAPSAPERHGRARRATDVVVRAALAGVVVVAVYLPFRDPVGLARAHLAEPDQTSAASLATPVALVALAVVAGGVVGWAWRQRPASALERAEVVVTASAPLLVLFAATLTRPGLPWYLLTPLAVVALARSVPLLMVLGALAATSFLMGWWESIDTRAHPLPEVHGSRTSLYLLVAGVAGVSALVAWAARRRAAADRPPGRERRSTAAAAVGPSG